MSKTSNIRKMFTSLLMIQIILNITDCLCDIASGYIAGNFLDSVAVSCNSLFSPFNKIVIGFATVFSSSSEILCGKYMGVGDKKSINKTFTNSVIISVVIGLLFSSLSVLFSGQIVNILGGNEIYSQAKSYFIAYSLGSIAYILVPVLANFLHMENEGNYVTASVIVLTVSYCLFGYILIQVLNLSYFGFGLTNSLSKLVTVLFLLIKIIKNKDQISFDKTLFDIKLIKNMFTLGFSSGTIGILVGIRNIFINNILVEYGGVLAVAARSVMSSGCSLVDAIITASISTITMVASVCVGENNRYELINLVKYFISRVFPIFVLFVILNFISTNIIAGIFSKDPQVISLASLVLRIYFPSTILEMISDCLISIYTIYEYKKFVNVYNICHYVLIHTIYAIALKNILGIQSVFTGYMFTEIICFIIILIFISLKNKRFPTSFDDITLGKESFNNVVKYNVTINDYNQIVNISKTIQDFLEQNNIDHRRSSLSGLMIEEIATNVFEHGYTKKDVKNKRIDIFVMSNNNDINIRIRDNSIAFNPTTRMNVFKPEDPCKNIGIRIVSKLANEFTYQNVFGFNNLIIKL